VVDRVTGLGAGADVYLTKPFYARELVARLRAMQRRPRADHAGPAPVRRFGDLTVEPGARRARIGDRDVDLSHTEFELLDALTTRAGDSLSRPELLERIWGPNWFGSDHVVEVHVSNLRRKLGAGSYIETVRGHGYRFVAKRE
jgi:DNA-binding response OmpR family regulator